LIYLTASLGELYSSALLATVLLSFAVVLVALPAALLYFGRAVPSGTMPGSLVLPLLLFLLGVVLNLVAAIPAACLSGCGYVTLDNAVRTTSTVIGFGLIWALVPRHPKLETLCAIYLVQGVVALAGSHVLLCRRRPIPRIRDMRLNPTLVSGLYRESASVFVSRIGWWLTLESTLLIAGYVQPPDRIADFALLRQIVTIGASITTAIPTAVAPHLAAAHSVGDREKVRSLYFAALRYSLILNVLWTAGLFFWARSVIQLLVGKEHFLGYGVLVPLALGSFLELHGATHGFFMWNIGKWPFAPYVVTGGLLNVLFGALGCVFYGFEGLAWGSTAAQALTMNWIQVAYALRASGTAFGVYWRETLLPALPYAAALAICGAVIKALVGRQVPADAMASATGRLAGFLWAATGISAMAILAAVFAWIFMLTTADRSYFLRLARIHQ
jgi:O-antigen/teichoic acid export membrane protein